MSVALQLTSCVYILGSFFIPPNCSKVFTGYIMKPLEVLKKIKGNTVALSHQRQQCVCRRSNYTCCSFVSLWCAYRVLQNCFIFLDFIMLVLCFRKDFILLLFYRCCILSSMTCPNSCSA